MLCIAERSKMITKKIIVDQSYYNDKVKRLGEVIRAGGLVAFPTETVYGLGGNALDKEAAKKFIWPKDGRLTIL